jgi:hypothetical protein
MITCFVSYYAATNLFVSGEQLIEAGGDAVRPNTPKLNVKKARSFDVVNSQMR